jgi:type II secretory pathway pseudopilin PulG
MRRLRRIVDAEGYSLVEMVVVMLVLSTILAGITTAFVQGSNAELHANNRFRAQLEATQAFDRLRRDVHCAGSATVSGQTLTLSGCATGSVSWCTVGSGSRYALYRQAGSSCDSTGKLYADYLTSPALFSYTAPVADTSLAKVHAGLVVDVDPANGVDSFELADDLVLRNSLRA